MKMEGSATIVMLLSAAALVLLLPRLSSAAPQVDPDRARQLVAEGGLMVDVRTPAEFRQGHVPGAVNIPLQELGRRLAELGPRDQSIVLYCRSGQRSAHARQILVDAGHEAVHDLGAMSRWRRPSE